MEKMNGEVWADANEADLGFVGSGWNRATDSQKSLTGGSRKGLQRNQPKLLCTLTYVNQYLQSL